MEYLKQPLTIKEMKKRMDEDCYVEGIVSIELSTIIDNDFEGFLDIISELLVGHPTLMNVNYSVVGHLEDDTILLKVSGDVSDILGYEDEDEEE